VCCFTSKNKSDNVAFCVGLALNASVSLMFRVPIGPRVLFFEGYPEGVAIVPDQPTPANSAEIIEGKFKIGWWDGQSGYANTSASVRNVSDAARAHASWAAEE
jgi:hypothetical protein